MHRLNAERGEREKKRDGERLTEYGGGLWREDRMERRFKEGTNNER